MAALGHCKHCWWWNQTGERTGVCWFNSYSEDSKDYTNIDSYCPDYFNRATGNKDTGTLKKWLKEQNFKYVTYRKI